ncbi:MAG: CDP-glucose 4,6-dehydratase [Bacteroidota bacterium]
MVKLFKSSYRDKKVLLTGHTGFKGSWLAIWLNELGADVVGYALDPKNEKDNFLVTGLSDKIKDIRANIRDKEKLMQVFREEKPEIVFHLAAQPLVLESYANPLDTFDTNIMGTANVLEAIRQTDSVHTGIMITSDKCYENKEQIWGYRERDPMGGHDPYSASKGAAELVIQSYRKSFGEKEKKAIASARAGNVIGGGDWSDYRLIPDIIKAIQSGRTIELRNPSATRPWQHVLEPLAGYLMLGAKMMGEPEKYAEAWNFGPYPNDIYPVKEVVDKMIKKLNKGQWKDISNPNQLHEANLLTLDITKALTKLNWKPVLSFDETIDLTIDWYKNYSTHPDMYEFCKNQIKEYQHKMEHR